MMLTLSTTPISLHTLSTSAITTSATSKSRPSDLSVSCHNIVASLHAFLLSIAFVRSACSFMHLRLHRLCHDPSSRPSSTSCHSYDLLYTSSSSFISLTSPSDYLQSIPSFSFPMFYIQAPSLIHRLPRCHLFINRPILLSIDWSSCHSSTLSLPHNGFCSLIHMQASSSISPYIMHFFCFGSTFLLPFEHPYTPSFVHYVFTIDYCTYVIFLSCEWILDH
jgi:hypothetical protein